MTKKIDQQLINNISQILKRSLTADATLADLRNKNKAVFKSIFTEEAGFNSSADTFQPYVEEIADDLTVWQEHQNQKLLITLVKKIEKLFSILANFEQTNSLIIH